MDPSTNFSLIQSTIVWTLLGLLLIWMVVFAVLALRTRSHETFAEEAEPAPSQSLPGISSLVPKIHMVTSSSRQSAETVNAETTISSEAVARS
jgi:predicted secreted protein